ncbi:MAG TPA: glycosyltransferase [Actinomycetales bacterium]|nr:glycosyltransferase [Actinomycetales bacterium]
MESVEVRPLSMNQLAEQLDPDRAQLLRQAVDRGRQLLKDRVVWNVNATATGGGVAEMLAALLAYARGAGIDTRWLVLVGDSDFFDITKRVHNFLHGSAGDGGPLGEAERRHYEAVLTRNLQALGEQVRQGDIVLLHDPQTAGLARAMRAAGAHVVWRCHIGSDQNNDLTRAGWDFLHPYLRDADAFIFSRKEYAPDWVDPGRLFVIPPSIDPASCKNRQLSEAQVDAVLRRVGLISDGRGRPEVEFTRRDGTRGQVKERPTVLLDGSLPRPDDRLVVQVSRWDRLKDMSGVLTSFAEYFADGPEDVHLVLAGGEVSQVADDPEGAEVLEECLAQWRGLPAHVRRRTHLAALPMEDWDENALIVNALQRHARVVVQKSLMEGFGLTVTEALWKGTPVIASAVGGIRDQIVDGRDGLLLEDPRDLEGLARLIKRVLDDEGLASRLGRAGHERAKDQFLGDRHLIQYVDLFAGLIR